jgi:hypothetical protein
MMLVCAARCGVMDVGWQPAVTRIGPSAMCGGKHSSRWQQLVPGSLCRLLRKVDHRARCNLCMAVQARKQAYPVML